MKDQTAETQEIAVVTQTLQSLKKTRKVVIPHGNEIEKELEKGIITSTIIIEVMEKMSNPKFDIQSYLSETEPKLQVLLASIGEKYIKLPQLSNINKDTIALMAILFGNIGAFTMIAAYESCDNHLSQSVEGIIASTVEQDNIIEAYRVHKDVINDRSETTK